MGAQIPEASGPHEARSGRTSAVPGAPGPRVQFSSKKCGCPAMGLPASCGSKGVRGIRGPIWGAGWRWRAWASRLAHGGGGGRGGPSLRHLPSGCISVRGNGSIVHTRFCSQTLFLGYKGAGSLGSQFSTGPENREKRKGRNEKRQNREAGVWFPTHSRQRPSSGTTPLPSSPSSSSPLFQVQTPFSRRVFASAVPSASNVLPKQFRPRLFRDLPQPFWVTLLPLDIPGYHLLPRFCLRYLTLE